MAYIEFDGTLDGEDKGKSTHSEAKFVEFDGELDKPDTKSGLDASLLDDQFKSGVAGMQSGFFANNAKNSGALLASMDRIDRGEKLSMDQDPLGYQDMTPEQRQQVRAQFDQNITGNVAKAVKYSAEQKSYDKNASTDQFIQQANDGNYADAWRTFNSDKLGILQQLTVSNAAQAIPQLAGGGIGVALRGGLPGLMAGMATGSYPMEYIASISESLQESGVDMNDVKAVEAKLRDPAFIKEIGNKATTRATVISAADAASGKLLTPLKGGELLKNVGRSSGNLVKEVGLEMGGEATAQLATDGKIKVGDVLAEGLGAGPQSVATTAWKTIDESRAKESTGLLAEEPQDKVTITGMHAPERREPTIADISTAQTADDAIKAFIDTTSKTTVDDIDALEAQAGMRPVGGGNNAVENTPLNTPLSESGTNGINGINVTNGNPLLNVDPFVVRTNAQGYVPPVMSEEEAKARLPVSGADAQVWRRGEDKIVPEPVASNNIVYANQAEADAAIAAGREQQSAAKRLSVMDQLLGSEAALTMQPEQLTKAFTNALAAEGFANAVPTEQETERLMRGVAARDAMLESEKPDVIPSAPNEMDVDALIPQKMDPNSAAVKSTDPLGRVKTLLSQGYTLQGKQLSNGTERINLNRQELLYVKSNRKGKADDRNANGTGVSLPDGRAGSVEDRAGSVPSGSPARQAVAQGDLQGRAVAEVSPAPDGESVSGADVAADGQRTLDPKAKRTEAIAALEKLNNTKLRAESAKKGIPVWKKTAIADILQVRAQQTKQNRSESQRKTYAKARGIDPDRDHLAAAVSKLGGISLEGAKSQLRLSPEELNRRGAGIRRMFTKAGKPVDQIGEALAEMGYVDRDENGKADYHDMTDKIARAANGEDILTANGMMLRAQEEAAAAWEQVGAQDSTEYQEVESYADDFNDAESAYAAELMQDPPLDAGVPINNLTDEEIDALFDRPTKAANGREAQGDTGRQAADGAEGTGAAQPAARAGEAAGDFALSSETRDEANARIEAQLAEVKAQQAEILRRMDEDKAAAEKKEIDARQAASAENFELGQDANDSLSGQKGLLFSKAPAVGTTAFDRWFGKSNVTDENGNPLKLYHGTSGDFNEFSEDFAGAIGVEYSRRAVFATTDPTVASDYALNTYSRELADAMRALQKAKRGGDPDAYTSEEYEKAYQGVKAAFKNLSAQKIGEAGNGGNVMPVYMNGNMLRVDGKGQRYMSVIPDAIIKATEGGYDGVIIDRVIDNASPASEYPVTIVATFNPAGVKSATGNNGQYSPTNPDIRFSKAPAVGSAAFRRWFGDSKIVNDDGSPKIVYHGTGHSFSEFSENASSMGRQGFYFAEDANFAAGFGLDSADDMEYTPDNVAQGASVMPVYLSIKNPVDVRNGWPQDVADQLRDVAEYNLTELAPSDFWLAMDGYGGEKVKAKLKSLGYDGLLAMEPKNLRSLTPVYVAFSPNQIKSAIGNEGTFDDSNPDIRKSVGTYRTGNTVDAIESAIAGLRAKWQGFRNIEVVQSVADLPQHLQDIVGDDSRAEGFYVPWDNTVWMIADHLPKGREVWTAAHETAGHAGLRALGDKSVDDAVRFAGKNRYIADLAKAIAKDRGDDSHAVEEALAEMQAAIVTNDFGALESRYGIIVPEASRNGIRGSIGRVLAAVKKWLAGVMGIEVDEVSDADVRALLDDARKAVETDGVYQTGRMEPALASMSEQLASELRDHMDTIADRGMINAAELLDFVQGREEPGAVALADWLDAMGDAKVSASSVERYLDAAGVPMFSKSGDAKFKATSKEANEQGMRDLLSPINESTSIGPEKGKFVQNGISKFISQFGSHRYVYSVDGVPVSVLQVMSRDKKTGRVANVFTDQSARRKGYAAKLLSEAQKDFDSLEYSDDLSNDGAAWLNGIHGDKDIRSSVAPKQTESDSFRRWFGNSAVVNPDGSPMVVYHGTNSDITEFDTKSENSVDKKRLGSYFTANEMFAGMYGDNVMPVYLSIQNPFDLTGMNARDAIKALPVSDRLKMELRGAFRGDDFSQYGLIESAQREDIRKALEDAGYDGVKYTEGYADAYIAFKPTQVKSATGNNGNFDPSNKDIRFSKAQQGMNFPQPAVASGKVKAVSQTVPAETTAQKSQRIVQDKFNRFKIVQEWLKEKGVNLSENANVYQAEGTMHGRVSSRKQDFRELKVAPMIEKTQKAGVTMQQVADYLKFQHAPEANVRAREVNRNPDATAYGITDDEARTGMAELVAANKNLPAIANEWRQITEETKKILLDGEIITQEMVDAWDAAYSLYIPVKGDEDAQGTGKGLSVNGKQKGRTGHGLRDEAIIENILRDHERAISLDEKNKVGYSLIHFALEAKDDSLVTLGKPEKRKVLRDETAYVVSYEGNPIGIFKSSDDAKAYVNQEAATQKEDRSKFSVSKSSDPRVVMMASPMLADNEVTVYARGHAIRVQLTDEILARAYTNMGVERVNLIMQGAREVHSWLSKAYTGYNPEFAISNPIRDFTAGMINLTGDYGIGMTAKIAANYGKAVKELIKARKDPRASKYVTEYRAAGGSTGAAYLSDLERIGEDVMSAYNEYAGAMNTYQRVYTEQIDKGRSETQARSMALLKAGTAGFKKIPVIGHFLNLMERINAVTENALRLATFMTLRENGYSAGKAALAAKDSTVNFSRRGEVTNQAGALYLFFNPNVQGTARLIQALGTSEYRNQARALTGMMAVMAYVLAEVARGGDDDDEEKWKRIPGHIKDRNMVVMFGDQSLMLPIPYGYGIFYAVGNAVSDYLHGESGSKVGVRMASSVLENFSPVGNPIADGRFTPFQLLPTIPKMALAPTINENSFGQQIMPKRFNDSKPDSQLMYRNTKGTLYDKTASGLNSLTGGSKYQSGAVDVSPETLKYWVSTITGGTGKFVTDSVNLPIIMAQGATPELNEMPVVRRFVRESGISDARSAFFEAAEEAKTTAGQYSAAMKDRNKLAAKEIMGENKSLESLAKHARSAAKQAKAKRDAIDEIRLDEKLGLDQKRLKIKEIERQEQAIYSKFMEAFETAEKKAAKSD